MTSDSTARFRYYLRTRYQECDPQGVVFNSRYSDYADLACFEFLRAALPKPTDAYDGTFEIQIWTSRIGTTSLTLCTEIRRAGQDGLLGTTETVYVHVDAATFKKREIAPAMRAALEAGARGKVTDHAGWLR
jgi:acyl-CoA thioester hydrolase